MSGPQVSNVKWFKNGYTLVLKNDKCNSLGLPCGIDLGSENVLFLNVAGANLGGLI